MPSPADRQAEALADVERIASAMFETVSAQNRWQQISEGLREHYRRSAAELLRSEVIRVGRRPEIPKAIPGQTTVDEQLTVAQRANAEPEFDPFALEDDCDADD